jgi:1,4-alpha-glucan branching enzyme
MVESGFSADPVYREYYRDAGHDLGRDYLAESIRPFAARVATGLKYHRVSGHRRLDQKALYDPEAALVRAGEHAQQFYAACISQLKNTRPGNEKLPILVLPLRCGTVWSLVV